LISCFDLALDFFAGLLIKFYGIRLRIREPRTKGGLSYREKNTIQKTTKKETQEKKEVFKKEKVKRPDLIIK